MKAFNVQEKGELKILNLNLVTHVAVQENNISFYFVTDKPLIFTEPQLGSDEFKRIRDYWVKGTTITAL